MPFPFTELCNLFSRLEAIESRDPPYLPDQKSQSLRLTVESWFKSHHASIARLTVEGAAALLSAILPERRTDRVYNIQAGGLCRILCRSLHLTADRAKDLRAYTEPRHGDLGACLERVLVVGSGPPALPAVNLEDIDDLLIVLAGHSRFSDPSIARLLPGSSEARDTQLANVFLRLEPVQAKWLVRLVLKDLSGLKIEENLVLQSFHFLLPDLLRFQQNFEAAILLLRGPLAEYHERPDPRSRRLLRRQAAELIKPRVGIKVGRPTFHKARSIDHCLKMAGQQSWVLERKYDGEYCEIHIDMSKSNDAAECIKIFSESGKDSTADRKGIHKTLIRCLRLGQPGCKIKQKAIILGELVVWSDVEQEPLPFEKIRKFVTRSGVPIGTDEDSQRRAHEHLAIVFFDLLLLDDNIVMAKPVEERRRWLRELYTKIPGRALGAQWTIVDFEDGEASKKALLNQFAASNAARCEGLVLKPCGVPYFSLHHDAESFTYGFVKLKKDYIAGLGEEADIAVVGASYNAQQAAKSGLKNIKWTDFHLGMLTNKEEVQRYDATPKFKVVGMIQQSFCIPKPIFEAANILGNLSAIPYSTGMQVTQFDLDIPPACQISHIFTKPLVFEVLGSGYEKPSNTNYFMLRHARVTKLHQDRSWKDCVSFQELQEQARASRATPTTHSEGQEVRDWIVKLERKCRKRFEREKTATPKSCVTEMPSSTGLSSKTPRGDSMVMQTDPARERRHRKALSDVSGKSVASQTTYAVHGQRGIELIDGTTMVKRPTTGMKRASRKSDGTPCPDPKRQRLEPLANVNKSYGGPVLSSIAAKGTKRPENHVPTANTSRPRQCEASNCLFANTIIYASPCVAYTPYITSDLIPAHYAITADSLSHWDRDSHPYPPLTEIVSESQAYEGLRKVVLVESNRKQALEDVIQQLSSLNGGNLRERVEVWDWRALELAAKHSSDGPHFRRWFVGATVWDASSERVMFVWSKTIGH